MKNLLSIFLCFTTLSSLNAQNYLISFTGTGESSTLGKVRVENLTKGTSLLLNGSDQLNLTATVGLPELNTGETNKIMVFPNPMNSFSTIELETKDNANALIELYDLAGKQVFYKREYLLKGQHTFDLSGIEKGTYLLKIQSEKYLLSSKIFSANERAGQPEIKLISSKSFADGTNINDRKSRSAIVQMGYNDGDIILASGTAEPTPYTTYVVINPLTVSTVTFLFVSSVDGDGNYYPVVNIAGRWWMAQNLKTTKYKDNSIIPKISNPAAWWQQTGPSYIWYNNDSVKYSNPYGALYNWHTVNTGKLCPAGWHVPNDEEWNGMIDYIGGGSTAGGYLKESGTTHWNDPNKNAVNSTGFSAVAGGNCGIEFKYQGVLGIYWSASERSASSSSVFWLESTNGACLRDPSNKSNGWSVRCIKD